MVSAFGGWLPARATSGWRRLTIPPSPLLPRAIAPYTEETTRTGDTDQAPSMEDESDPEDTDSGMPSQMTIDVQSVMRHLDGCLADQARTLRDAMGETARTVREAMDEQARTVKAALNGLRTIVIREIRSHQKSIDAHAKSVRALNAEANAARAREDQRVEKAFVSAHNREMTPGERKKLLLGPCAGLSDDL